MGMGVKSDGMGSGARRVLGTLDQAQNAFPLIMDGIRKPPPGWVPFWDDEEWMASVELDHVKKRNFDMVELAQDPVHDGRHYIAYANVFYEYIILFIASVDPRTMLPSFQCWKICGFLQGDPRAPGRLRYPALPDSEPEWEPTRRELCRMGPDDDDWWFIRFGCEDWYPGKSLVAKHNEMSYPAIIDLWTYKPQQESRRNQLIRLRHVSVEVEAAIRYPGRGQRDPDTGIWTPLSGGKSGGNESGKGGGGGSSNEWPPRLW